MARRDESTGPSPEALRQQLQKANTRAAALEVERDILRAELGRDPDRLLNEIATALHLAREVSNPQLAHSHDQAGIKHSTEPPTPGAATAQQRRAANHLRTQLHRALNEFEASRQRNWMSRERVPSVRCVNRGCGKVNKRLPAWDHRGPNEFCGGCGQRLHLAEQINV